MQCSKALHVKEKKNEFSRPKENNQNNKGKQKKTKRKSVLTRNLDVVKAPS